MVEKVKRKGLEHIIAPFQLRRLKTAIEKDDWEAVAKIGAGKSFEVGKLAIDSALGKTEHRTWVDKEKYLGVIGFIGIHGSEEIGKYAVDVLAKNDGWGFVAKICAGRYDSVPGYAADAAMKAGETTYMLTFWEYGSEEAAREAADGFARKDGWIYVEFIGKAGPPKARKYAVDTLLKARRWDSLENVGRHGPPEIGEYVVDLAIREDRWRLVAYLGSFAERSVRRYAINEAARHGKKEVLEEIAGHNKNIPEIKEHAEKKLKEMA